MSAERCWFKPLLIYIGFCLLQVALAQRIAESKCQYYAETTIEISYGGSLIVNPEVQKFTSGNCSSSVDLIVGGQEALLGEFPHQALLGYAQSNVLPHQYEFLCGGSLISEWFILTAAHCTTEVTPKIVRLGEHNLKNDKDGQQDYRVANFSRHPKYSSRYSYHDIALVELAREVQFNDRIRPACLWTSELFNMSSAVASGFGRTANNSTMMSSKLMKTKLIMLDKEECNEKYPFDRILEDGLSGGQLCVGSQQGGNDTCNGDSGGPLQVALDIETCIYHIVGLTSFGSPRCGFGNSAAVYTRVASYLDWIEQVVWGNEFY